MTALVMMILLVGVCQAQEAPPPPERVLPVDPVELVGGKETQGNPELTVERDGYVYRFASVANREAFLANPGKYELADGGACGRMGALSGLSDARRYVVHEGRIYAFASDGCRAGFLKDPEKSIDRPDNAPHGTQKQIEQGRAIVDRLVAWAGGRDRLASITSYQHRIERIVPNGDTTARVVSKAGIQFPATYVRGDCWEDSCWMFAASDQRGVLVSGARREALAHARVEVLRRTLGRLPLAAIRASFADDFVAVSDGEGEIDGTKVDFVRTWHAGIGLRLGVKKETGRLVSLAYRGREGGGNVQAHTCLYTEYATVDGVTLPKAWRARAGDKEGQTTLTEFVLNQPVELPDLS